MTLSSSIKLLTLSFELIIKLKDISTILEFVYFLLIMSLMKTIA